MMLEGSDFNPKDKKKENWKTKYQPQDPDDVKLQLIWRTDQTLKNIITED